MKKLLLVCLLLSFATTSFASDYSLGVIVGTPTGLSGKYQLSSSNVIQADLSGGYSSVDYMWIDGRDFDVDGLSWLYGVGGVVNKNVGVRGVTGVEYDLNDYPFHFFGNLSFTVTDGTQIGVALGARYNF